MDKVQGEHHGGRNYNVHVCKAGDGVLVLVHFTQVPFVTMPRDKNE